MKKFLKIGIFALITLIATNLFAQSAADKIVGLYSVEEEGRQSKVRFTKCNDGSYQGQIVWLSEPNNADGTRKMDVKNPNPELRKVPADQVVIIYGIRYNAQKQTWGGGYVYKPINGKTYKVECSFDSEQILRVKGSLGPISLSRYWKKIE